MAIDIRSPNNPADTIVTIAISGNRLVSILNAVQAMMHETSRSRFEGNATVFISDSYRELNETVECLRDQLSAQRMSAQGFTVEEINAAFRANGYDSIVPVVRIATGLLSVSRTA